MSYQNFIEKYMFWLENPFNLFRAFVLCSVYIQRLSHYAIIIGPSGVRALFVAERSGHY